MIETTAFLFPLVSCPSLRPFAEPDLFPPVASLTKDEWKARLQPALSESLQTANDTIMQTKEVQSWLRSAAMDAAETLGQQRGRQGEMQGYSYLMDALEDELPALLDAIEELTEECGTIDLKWRPMHPPQSRLYVAFDRPYTVTLFCRLSDCTDAAARTAIATVVDALPEGEPFPNRPNEVTGLVARDGRGVGVRVKEHLRDDGGTAKSVTLLPADQQPQKNLSGPEVVQNLQRLLCTEPAEGA